MHGFQGCNLRHAIRKISRKARNAGTDNQIHLLVFGILHHALESIPLAQRCAGFSLITVNILQIPVFRFCNLFGVIKGLIFDGRNLLFAGGADTGINRHAFQVAVINRWSWFCRTEIIFCCFTIVVRLLMDSVTDLCFSSFRFQMSALPVYPTRQHFNVFCWDVFCVHFLSAFVISFSSRALHAR